MSRKGRFMQKSTHTCNFLTYPTEISRTVHNSYNILPIILCIFREGIYTLVIDICKEVWYTIDTKNF